MTRKVIYEITAPSEHFNIKGDLWRVELHEDGDVTVLRFSEYVDADRVGFVGYMEKMQALPTQVLLEAADAIRRGEVPTR